MNNLNKPDLTSSICHVERFSNSEIPIYNSKVPEKMNRIQAVAKCYAYEANATRSLWRLGRLYFNAVNLIRENQNLKTIWWKGHVTLKARASRRASSF